MKFKVGDKVKVKKGLEVGKIYGNITVLPRMKNTTKGKITCITDNKKYGLDSSDYFYSEEMLQLRFSWKKFKKGKFAVHCKTEEEAKDFFKKAKKHEIRWCDEEKLSDDTTNWEEYESETCYNCDWDGLCFANCIYYKDAEERILEWSDYMDSKPKENAPENPIKDWFKLAYLKRLKAGGYNWIAKNNNSRVYAFIEKPVKQIWVWKSTFGVEVRVNRIIVTFPEIQWTDEEPTLIDKLIEQEEQK